MRHSWIYIVWFAQAVISFPLAMNWIPPNGWYGFRTPATLSDPELWRRVNIFAGWSLLITALIGLVITFLMPDFVDHWSPVLGVGLVTIATVISFIYLAIINRNR